MGFFKSDEYTYWEQKPNSTFKNVSCRKDFFQKLTKFSQGNNVLYGAASNRDGFLWRDTCVSSTQLNRPIRIKRPYPDLETTNLEEVLLKKANSILIGKQCARGSSF
jgi:hypothetical protein